MLDQVELTTPTLISLGEQTYKETSVLQTGEFRLIQFIHKTYTSLSCSVGAYLSESGQVVYEWSEEGPVYGPNGQLELDPDNQQCISDQTTADHNRQPATSILPPTQMTPTTTTLPPTQMTTNRPPPAKVNGARPVFATCKNNCPGGE